MRIIIITSFITWKMNTQTQNEIFIVWNVHVEQVLVSRYMTSSLGPIQMNEEKRKCELWIANCKYFMKHFVSVHKSAVTLRRDNDKSNCSDDRTTVISILDYKSVIEKYKSTFLSTFRVEHYSIDPCLNRNLWKQKHSSIHVCWIEFKIIFLNMREKNKETPVNSKEFQLF